MWSLRTLSCDGQSERSTRVPIGGGRIDLLSRSEHYLGAETVCALELEVDETDPAPLRLRGTTEDGVPFDLELPVPTLAIERPMSFVACEHAVLIDPDPILQSIADSSDPEQAAAAIGSEVPDTLWFGSRAQAELDHPVRWSSIAPPSEERDAARCRGLADDTGSSSERGRPGGGPGCATVASSRDRRPLGRQGPSDPQGGKPTASISDPGRVVAGLFLSLALVFRRRRSS
jgi:hypothetical protein